ncbi:MAG: N-formylglutamate amidohydrolase [Rhodospirillales bacterium]
MSIAAATSEDLPYEVLAPARQTAPLVFASPHSGDIYPPDFVARSRLDMRTLRRSEDSYVDELFAAAPSLGAPLIRALFPRAYVDPNREPYELDPAMFDGPLPDFVNRNSSRVAAGLGTVARVVANGETIYRGKLSFAEAEQRIANCYRPYHGALSELVAATQQHFGCAMLVDCHSMPSVGGPMERDSGAGRVDIVLGDCHGVSCDPRLTDLADRVLRAEGFAVQRNAPYSGGFTTQHYGRPAEGVHTLQIEINRGLYMNEFTYERAASFANVRRRLTKLIAALAAFDPSTS